MQAQLSKNRVNTRLTEVMTRLSTGKAINRAEDDAAGLSISNKLHARLSGIISCPNKC